MGVEGDNLILVIDLNGNFGPSASGKSVTIGSTEGATQAPGHPDVQVNLNVYKPVQKKG